MHTELLPYPGGQVEYGVAGTPDRGRHATLFLHGLAGSIEDARPLASGVPGRKVFAHLPGHGRSTGPDPLSYSVLAEAARAVADHKHVRAALGISLGAATLLRILAETPDRFERVVLYLPAVADLSRAPAAVASHYLLADRLAAADHDGVVQALLQTQPEAVRTTVLAREWAGRRAAELLADLAAGGADPHRLLPLASAVPLVAIEEAAEVMEAAAAAGRQVTGGQVADGQALDKLRAVQVPVLVVAQEGDPAHPVVTARRLAAALPAADLVVFDERGALWGHRRELRELVAPFLAAD